MGTCLLDASKEELGVACFSNQHYFRINKLKTEGSIESLPDELLLQCLSRVSGSYAGPGCILLRGVCKRWRKLVCSPDFFQIRKSINLSQAWLITLTERFEGGLLCKLFDTVSERCQRLPCSWNALENRYGYGSAVVDQEIFALGGYYRLSDELISSIEYTTAVNAYNPVLKLAREGPPMAIARTRFGCCSGEGRIYIIGGFDSKGNSLSSAEVLLTEKNKWKAIKSMPHARNDCIAEYLNGKVYVLGGDSAKPETDKWQSRVDMYDSVSDTWQPVCDLPTFRNFHTAIMHSRLCVIGGYHEHSYNIQCFNSPLVLDEESNEWKIWKRGSAYPALRTVNGVQNRLFCQHIKCKDLQSRPYSCLSAQDELFLIRRCDDPYCRHIHRFVPSLVDSLHGTTWQCIHRKSRFSSLLLEAGDCWQHAITAIVYF